MVKHILEKDRVIALSTKDKKFDIPPVYNDPMLDPRSNPELMEELRKLEENYIEGLENGYNSFKKKCEYMVYEYSGIIKNFGEIIVAAHFLLRGDESSLNLAIKISDSEGQYLGGVELSAEEESVLYLEECVKCFIQSEEFYKILNNAEGDWYD